MNEVRRGSVQRLRALFGGGGGKPAATTRSGPPAIPSPAARAPAAVEPQTETRTRTELKQVSGGVFVGGVSLRHLEDLVEGFSEEVTMTKFVAQLVKPRTAAKQESLLELLAREEPHIVRATAEVFVSYVWAYPLREVVAALKHTLLVDGVEDVFVWLDGVCVNQHRVTEGATATPEELQQTFGESLRAIGKVAMVLVNWRDPAYAKRIWCVFEAYVSKKAGVEVVLVMSENEERSLVEAMVGNEVGYDFLNTLFGSVNVELAKAKEPNDQEAILTLIRDFGVADVNGVVLSSLKAWMVTVGDLALRRQDQTSKDAAFVCLARACVHRALGEFDEELQWGDKALAIWDGIPGADELVRATILTHRGAGLQALGLLDEALDVHGQILALRSKCLGPDHPDVAQSLNNRAECLRALGHLMEALSMYDQALAIDVKVLGPDHMDVASDHNNRGACLYSLGRFNDALDEFDKALQIRAKALGTLNHPTIAETLNNKAVCLKTLGRFHEALPLYDQALAIDMNVYGPDHPDVATDLNNRAGCLLRMGHKDEASRVGKQALDVVERTLGPNHPTTVQYAKVWGS